MKIKFLYFRAYNHQYAIDKFIFCRKGVDKLAKISKSDKNYLNIWIVTDARRPSDIEYFRANYPKDKVKTIRINANDVVRSQRYWKYTTG